MRKTRAMFSILAVVALAATTLVIAATTAGAVADPVTKVTICHRTNSDSNPYVEITPDVSGVLNGHAKKHNDLFIWGPTLKASHQKWGDIIPAFDYMDGGVLKHFDGLNLTTVGGPGGTWTGAEVLENGCSFDKEPPPPPDTGSLDLTKIVTSTPPAGTPVPFTIHVTCTDSGIDEDVTFGPPPADFLVGETKTFDGLLSGDTCTVSEVTSGFTTGTAVHINVDGTITTFTTPTLATVDVEIPVDDTTEVTVNNDFTDVLSEVVVTPTDPGTTPVVTPAAAVAAAPAFTG